MQRLKRVVVAIAIVAVYGCAEKPPPPTASASPPEPVESSPTPIAVASPAPIAVVGSIPPLECEFIASTIIDYASDLTGVPDIVAATIASREVEHLPDDRIMVDGNETAIVRGGRTYYVFQWFQPEGGGWLLGGTETCSDSAPQPSGIPDESAVPSPSARTLPPLTCKESVTGINDFPSPGATGVADPLEATRTTEAVNHVAGDVVTRTGNSTQIVRDGEIVYVGEWSRAEDGTWLLGQYRACQAVIPARPEE